MPTPSQNARGFGGEADQFGDGISGAALGAGLKVASKQDQNHDNGGGLIIHIGATGRQNRRREGGHHRKPKGRQSAKRHQSVHVWRPLQEGWDAKLIELTPRPNKDERGQQKLKNVRCPKPDVSCDPMVQRWIKMPAHFGKEHRSGQNCRQDDRPPKVFNFLGFIPSRRFCLTDASGVARLF